MSPASYTETSLTHDKLVAGPFDRLHSRKVTLVTPENRTRGAVLGKTITAATVIGAALAGNTGNGGIGTLSAGSGVQVGVYRAVCIEPAANAGKFAVYDPNGVFIGQATVAVEFAGQVVFTIADGATDFAAGDSFTITVSAPTEKYKLSVAAGTDGSQVPDAILAEDANATAADVEALVYDRGDFAEGALTLGAGHTAATIREGLRVKGITLISTQGA